MRKSQPSLERTADVTDSTSQYSSGKIFPALGSSLYIWVTLYIFMAF